MKIFSKLTKIFILLTAVHITFSGLAYAKDLNEDDFDLIQVAALANYEQLREEINIWDDFTNARIVVAAGFVLEILKGEIVSQFVQKTKDLAESARRDYNSYQENRESERHERHEREVVERARQEHEVREWDRHTREC